MKNSSTLLVARRTISLALLLLSVALLGFVFSSTSSSQAPLQPAASSQPAAVDEPADVAAFRHSVGGAITPMIIELKGDPGVIRKVAADQKGQPLGVPELFAHSQELASQQDAFIAQLNTRGVRALMRQADVPQINGSVRHVEYRFTYLLNGFVAYVADEDIERLRAFPEVAHVSVAESPTFHLDKAIDYSLGTQTNPADRRTAVYGANQEFSPATNVAGHPEAPRATKLDGFEGQNIRIAVIDSGVDWRHPMFGGTGNTTPLPRVSGEPASPDDNRKVIYYYALSSPGDPTDDFGHGTLVASCAAGYSVDGNTPPRLGYGTGRDGVGVGPTINGAQLFGTAPQAQIMAYKVCGPAPQCPGDIPLAMEDAASPFTLIRSGTTGPTPVAKPIADVINLSLGDTSGDPAAASARAANNAALAGTIVVASAGNSGPGAGTIGSPSAATLAISVGASLDPGSVAGSDVLAPGQIPLETRTPATPGPSPETGASSNQNTPQAGERQGMRIFPVAGGGSLPNERNPGDPALNTGSVSAHYVFVDRRDPATPIPSSVTNRIAVVKGSGTFASIANPVAAFNPAAILIVTPVESATAVVVVGGIPTYTINPNDGDYLLDLLTDNDDNSKDPANGAISQLPLRLAETISLPAFRGSMAGFSSRGPNDHPNARFRTIKPDVTAPGVGVAGAATVEGLPDETVGLASASGYTQANGTSFSGPITAGAMALVRQYVRETLQLDETDSATDRAKPDWRARRFDTVTVARALLMNSATNLRNGFGVPDGDGAASVAAVNEMGAGHINVAAALQGKAIMVAPTDLLTTPSEYTPQPTPTPSPGTSPTPLKVLIPAVSFGPVPVVGVNAVVTRSREVIIRDVGNGAGAGTYNLTTQNNRLADNPAFVISYKAMDGTPISSVTVPANGSVSFLVEVAADGNRIIGDPTEFQWYVSATSATQALRMPFYYRAVRATIANTTSPDQQAPVGTEQPSPTPSGSCPGDTNGDYTVKWTYTKPATGPAPVGFRVQEATRSESKFFDNADEPLVGGANSKWTGSAQWNSQVNPETGSLAYFIPDTANQAESLTMVGSVALPPGGATLSFDTFQSTEEGFDFAHVDVSTDGVNYNTVASFSGVFAGTRFLDLTAYAGQTIKVRFRMTSDLVFSDVGWYVENIRVSSDDFRVIGNTAASATSLDVTGRSDGTYFYRVAAIFDNPNPAEPGTTVTGPYSNVRCVTVSGSPNATPTPTPTPSASPTPTASPSPTATASPTPTASPTATPSPTAEPSPTASASPTPASLLNISSRLRVQRDDNVLIGGLIITGTAPKRVIVRAIGPSLNANGQPVPGRLEDPVLFLHDGNSAPIADNDNWKESSDREEIERSGLAPSDDRESVIVRTLPPGNYTAVVRGKDGSTGIGVVEAYDRDETAGSTQPASNLANISTRGFVETGDNVLIGGFIAGRTDGPTGIAIRGIGPSLSSKGVPGSMQDPTIEVRNANGNVIRSNDNWREAPNRSDIESRGLAPEDEREAVVFLSLQPGAYTAILRGKDSTTGVGLVEIYNVR